MTVQVAIINTSQTATDQECADAALAIDFQVKHHFNQYWHTSADVRFYPTGTTPPQGAWKVNVEENLSVSGALGYHDQTAGDVPLAYVGAAVCKQYGVSVSSVLSHEILEMLGDPLIDLCSQIDNSHVYAYEACDPVEQASYQVSVTRPNGGTAIVEVSDFVVPTWFDTGGTASRYDWLHKLTAPAQLLPGGSYIGVGTATSTGIRWSQKNADGRVTPITDPDDARGFPQMCNRPQIRAARSGS